MLTFTNKVNSLDQALSIFYVQNNKDPKFFHYVNSKFYILKGQLNIT